MSDGCTSCGRKGGCDHRKATMFAAIEAALARLYPTRRWEHRQEDRGEGRREGRKEDDRRAGERAGRGEGPAAGPETAAPLAVLLRERLAQRLSASCRHVPGRAEEYCAYLYVLCTGRSPSLIELREGLLETPPELPSAGRGARAPVWEELHLRVALSDLAPFAAVQQVTVRGEVLGDRLWVEEAPRAGVFDPPLLPRFQKLVAVLTEVGIRNLDCGDIARPPAGFDPGGYQQRYGELPGTIDYLFFAQPAGTVTSTLARLPGPPAASPSRPLPNPDRRSACIE